MARPVVAELQRLGFETHEEVAQYYGGNRADIVGIRGPVVCVVECKVSMSLALMEQAQDWLHRAHYVIAAYGHGRKSYAVEDWFKWRGIGMWHVSFESVTEQVAPRLYRTADAGRVRKACVDGN